MCSAAFVCDPHFVFFCVWTVRARSSKLEHKIFARFLLSKIVIFHLTHLRFSTTPQGVRTTPQGVRPLKGCAPSRGAPPQGVRPLKECAPSRGAPPQGVRPLNPQGVQRCAPSRREIFMSFRTAQILMSYPEGEPCLH